MLTSAPGWIPKLGKQHGSKSGGKVLWPTGREDAAGGGHGDGRVGGEPAEEEASDAEEEGEEE